jgi:BirA family biotin operon repressor/biotin-[acetyl-CoA-carboxylase] ligase
VEEACGVEAQVKWPNDVVVAGRKVAGVLLEADEDSVVCGIGVNVNGSPESLPAGAWAPAGSLRQVAGRTLDRGVLLAGLLAALEARYDTWSLGGLAPLHGLLTARDWLAGRPVRAGAVSGTAAGIGADGRYGIVDGGGSTHLVESGELELA